jgi:predicted amidohydrolase YtcJ
MRALILALGLLVVAAVPEGLQAPEVKIILGATVINPTAAVPAADAVVVITGSRITQVAPAATFRPPTLAETIDAGGKFVIPGLADMHNHLGAGGMSLGPQREN